ncbi:hypothetical protein F5880DRAFT_1548963 [Lentinula raphanica]|nr:hypothetical protein F5880DRAFT_1548963 [Lentinula raphanica]
MFLLLYHLIVISANHSSKTQVPLIFFCYHTYKCPLPSFPNTDDITHYRPRAQTFPPFRFSCTSSLPSVVRISSS